MTKNRKITLRKRDYIPGEAITKPKYEVVNVTNSVDYSPGEMLEQHTVADLCRRKEWTVVTQS
jgi:hypothetical protein